MNLSHRKIFGILVLSACILYACTHRHEAYSRGDNLYLDGERYIEITGRDYLYKESNKRICKAEDGSIIYEVEGDKEYNYVVCRSFWEAGLFVKESYIPDRTIVSAVCFDWDRDHYISDEKILDCVLTLGDNDELVDDSEELQKARIHGKDIYVKYGDEAVGKYIGDIFPYKDKYMYYNDSKQIVTVLTADQLELLQEYL